MDGKHKTAFPAHRVSTLGTNNLPVFCRLPGDWRDFAGITGYNSGNCIGYLPVRNVLLNGGIWE
jgi:hypothetical protein